MKKFFLVIIFLISNSALADTSLFELQKSEEDFIYPDYYRIKEDPRLQNVNLLVFDHIEEKFPLPSIPYNRNTQFGGWLRDTSGETCLNTRGKVLVRDSVSSVTYTANGCTVQSGEWADSYTAIPHALAKDVQIDHVVALKNAYMTGAHEWDFNKRCLYANYLGNNFHLLSVDGKENLKKSDLSPSGYIPPNKAFTCEFIKDWLNIKLIWSLRMTPKESEAINKIISENNCNPQEFIIPSADIKGQRSFMNEHANLCAGSTSSFESFVNTY